MASGKLLWTGPSLVDGHPIMVVATGLTTPSNNKKTGPMAQVFILRHDIPPMEAVKTGQDESICGTCRHRGTSDGTKNKGRTCYVEVGKSVANVWRSYRNAAVDNTPNLLAYADRNIRLGAYGDPGAVPMWVWKLMLSGVPFGRITGYTHLWRTCDTRLSYYCMASVDTEDEAREAQATGWRTFRVKSLSEPKFADEAFCPASEAKGFATDCNTCMACGGGQSKARCNIVIDVHGPVHMKNEFTSRALRERGALT